MLEDENRSCCEAKEQEDISMYSFEFKNNTAEEAEATCEEKECTRRQMLSDIRALSFSIVELAEYLDTHPDDKKAIALHNEYANRLHDLKDKYQKVYGPLTIYYPCNKWRWLEGPWPWERGSI